MTRWAPSISVGLWLQLWSLFLMVSETVVIGNTCPTWLPHGQALTGKYTCNCCLPSVVSLQAIALNPFFANFLLVSAKKYDVDGNLFEIITSDETHYFLQAATAEERKEWIKAVQAVSKSGK